MQLTYNQTPNVAMAGMKADASDDTCDSLANGDTVTIPPGVAVIKGTSDAKAKLPGTSGDHFLGVTVYSAAGMTDLVNGGYAVADAMPVMRKGRIWVQVEEAVNKGDNAFIRYASGTGTQKGAFRKSADTSTAVQAKGFVYLTTASANGFALLEVDVSAHLTTF